MCPSFQEADTYRDWKKCFPQSVKTFRNDYTIGQVILIAVGTDPWSSAVLTPNNHIENVKNDINSFTIVMQLMSMWINVEQIPLRTKLTDRFVTGDRSINHPINSVPVRVTRCLSKNLSPLQSPTYSNHLICLWHRLPGVVRLIHIPIA